MSYYFDIIQSVEHKIQACGASTGHFIKTVALCDTDELAAFLFEAVNSHASLTSELDRLRGENKDHTILFESKDETIRQLTEELVRHLKTLKLIAAHRDCGCSPVCQCNTEEALRIEVDYLKDLALASLSPPVQAGSVEP